MEKCVICDGVIEKLDRRVMVKGSLPVPGPFPDLEVASGPAHYPCGQPMIEEEKRERLYRELTAKGAPAAALAKARSK